MNVQLVYRHRLPSTDTESPLLRGFCSTAAGHNLPFPGFLYGPCSQQNSPFPSCNRILNVGQLQRYSGRASRQRKQERITRRLHSGWPEIKPLTRQCCRRIPFVRNSAPEFDLARPPCLVEPGFQRPAQSQNHEPAPASGRPGPGRLATRWFLLFGVYAGSSSEPSLMPSKRIVDR